MGCQIIIYFQIFFLLIICKLSLLLNANLDHKIYILKDQKILLIYVFYICIVVLLSLGYSLLNKIHFYTVFPCQENFCSAKISLSYTKEMFTKERICNFLSAIYFLCVLKNIFHVFISLFSFIVKFKLPSLGFSADSDLVACSNAVVCCFLLHS